MHYSSPISKRLKTARLLTGISQKKLGIAAGIDEFSASARINQYERGKHAPDYLTIEKLAAILSVPVAYFYAREDDLAELILIFGALSAPKRKRVLELIRQ